MKNKRMFSLFALGAIALLGVGFVAAYQGDYSTRGPDYSDERQDAIHDAFNNLNYDAWVVLITESGRSSRVLSVVTEENFATFVEAHEAGEMGDSDRAAELRSNLGLNNGIGPRDGTGFGDKKGMRRGSMQGSGMKGQGNHFR